MTNALHCPSCGSQKVALQTVGTTDVLPTATGNDGLLITLDGDVQCLNGGNVWNPAQRIEQALDDQADALDFAQRKVAAFTLMR